MKKYNLGELANIITGPFGSQLHASDYVNDGVPSIMPKDIGDRVVIHDTIAHIKEDDAIRLSKYLVEVGDIVYSRRGDIERCALIGEADSGALCGTGCLRVRPNPRIVNSTFLSFYLSTPTVRKWVVSNATGATMPNLNSEILKKVPVVLPALKIQNIIADKLKCIDDKITINKKTISTLESLSKTLYDYYFLQFDFPDENNRPYKSSGGKMEYNAELGREIPAGWKVGNLYHIAQYENGLACQKYRPNDNEPSFPVVKIKEIHDGISADTERVSQNIPSENIIDDGDILFSWSATLEINYWVGGKAGLNQHIFKVYPADGFCKEFVYHQLKDYIVNFVRIAEARKTTMGHITKDHLGQSRIAIPPNKVLNYFFKKANPIHRKLIRCQQENRQLTALRDFLLPLLMNGQVTFRS